MEDKVGNRLANKIAGEIVLSEDPGKTIKKWREIFKLSQKDVANQLEVSPSVISDYESGRRQSPGIKIVSRIVMSFIALDREHGSKVIYEFANMLIGDAIFEVILDIKEFSKPVRAKNFAKKIDGEIVSTTKAPDRDVFGYTVIDSLRAILEFSPLELARIYGSTTERALIFTKVSTGRSPMIAIKMTSLRPAMVVLHNPQSIDKLAVKIAETENIPLIVVHTDTVEELIEKLRTNL